MGHLLLSYPYYPMSLLCDPYKNIKHHKSSSKSHCLSLVVDGEHPLQTTIKPYTSTIYLHYSIAPWFRKWNLKSYNPSIHPLHCMTWHYITLDYTTLHYITLHYNALHYITLHYITIHTYINIHTFICGEQNYFLPAMDMAKVCGPLSGLWRFVLVCYVQK